MRIDNIRRVADNLATIARTLEEAAVQLDDAELSREDRQKIGRSLRIAEREIDLLQRHFRRLLGGDSDTDC
jgi:uncharacterized protein Yka (UPF0111/DUF47 family)